MIRVCLVAMLLAAGGGPAAAPAPMAAGGGAAAAPAPTETSKVQAGERTVTGRTVIRDGHIDMGPRFIDRKWTIQIRDDTVRPSVWRNLPDVVLQAAGATRTQVPVDQRFAFLGAAGADVWVLPQVQRPGILWPGWNTQDPEVATTVNREVTWKLRGVDGPGHFVLFLNGNFGEPQIVFDSARPLPQETGVEVNTHVHGNWAFSAAGSYLLDVEMTGTTATGQAVADRETLRIFVGDGDATAAFGVTASASPAIPSPTGAAPGGLGTCSPQPDPGSGCARTGEQGACSPSPDPGSGCARPGPQAGESDDDSSSALPWLALGGVVVLALIAGGVLLGRRRRTR